MIWSDWSRPKRNKWRAYKQRCDTAVFCDSLMEAGLFPFKQALESLKRLRREHWMASLNGWFAEHYPAMPGDLFAIDPATYGLWAGVRYETREQIGQRYPPIDLGGPLRGQRAHQIIIDEVGPYPSSRLVTRIDRERGVITVEAAPFPKVSVEEMAPIPLSAHPRQRKPAFIPTPRLDGRRR